MWALAGDQSNPINLLIQVKAAWAKMLVIGFGVPALIRSKLFGEGPSAAGPSALYDWARGKVLYSINHKSGLIKTHLTTELTKKYRSNAKFPNDLIRFVLGYIQPFYGKSELDALERDLNSLAGKGDLSALIRMAIDWTSIRAVEEWAAN